MNSEFNYTYIGRGYLKCEKYNVWTGSFGRVEFGIWTFAMYSNYI